MHLGFMLAYLHSYRWGLGTKDSGQPDTAPAVALLCKGETGVFQFLTVGSDPAKAPDGSWRQITSCGEFKESSLSSGYYPALGYIPSSKMHFVS